MSRRSTFGGWRAVGLLLVVKLVCLFAWALVGGWPLLVAALVAGVGLVAAALAPEDQEPPRRRRVR